MVSGGESERIFPCRNNRTGLEQDSPRGGTGVGSGPCPSPPTQSCTHSARRQGFAGLAGARVSRTTAAGKRSRRTPMPPKEREACPGRASRRHLLRLRLVWRGIFGYRRSRFTRCPVWLPPQSSHLVCPPPNAPNPEFNGTWDAVGVCGLGGVECERNVEWYGRGMSLACARSHPRAWREGRSQSRKRKWDAARCEND